VVDFISVVGQIIAVPKVSVITPTYNAAATIGRAIATVQAQTFTDWEHIIIDDGSTDDTRAAVAAARDSRLQYLYQPNQGPGAARNHGVRVSQGEYVIFLDADDWWSPECLELLVSALKEKAQSPAAAWGDWAFVDIRGTTRNVQYRMPRDEHPLVTLLFRPPFIMHSILLDRAAWNLVGGFDQSLAVAEDWDLWLGLALNGCGFFHVPHTIAYYYWRPNSRSKNILLRAEALKTILDRFWGSPQVSASFEIYRNPSYASATLETCVAAMAIENIPLALEYFDSAIEYELSTLTSIDTYYRIIYADLAPFETSEDVTRELFNLQTAVNRIELILGHVQSSVDIYPKSAHRDATYAAYVALGKAAYNERQHAIARKYLGRAFKINPGNDQSGHVVNTLIKSLLPSRSVDVARKWRGGWSNSRI
jgi:GT2 family glycosyltransferase